MSTGDLPNNIRKLQKELKLMKYSESLNLTALAQGKAASLLPIYHFAFTSYSHAVAEFISTTDTELYGKTDLRFMEAAYKILRDLFNYKPPLTKEQFFNNGFAERKIIMCTEVMRLIQQKNKSLLPPKKAPTSAISNLGQMATSAKLSRPKVTDLAEIKSGGRRPLSNCSNSQSKSSSDLPIRDNRAGTDKSRHLSPRSSTEMTQPQVVNELIQPVSSPDNSMTRHIASHHSVSSPDNSMTRHIASHHSVNRSPDGHFYSHHHTNEDQSMSSSSDTSDDSRLQSHKSPPVHVTNVTSPPRVTKEVLPSIGRGTNVRGFNWAVITPSIAKTRSTDYSSRGLSEPPQMSLEEVEEDDGIETVVAATPAHSILEPPQNGAMISTDNSHMYHRHDEGEHQAAPQGISRSDQRGHQAAFQGISGPDQRGHQAAPKGISRPDQRGHQATPEYSPYDQGGHWVPQENQQHLYHETHIRKAIEQLTKCFGSLESGLTKSIESLNARMILVENRVSMMEAKMERVMNAPENAIHHTSTKSTQHISATCKPVQSKSPTATQTGQIVPFEMPQNMQMSVVPAEKTNHLAEVVKKSTVENNKNVNPQHHKPVDPALKSPLYDESTLVMFSPIRRVNGTPQGQSINQEDTFTSVPDTADPRRSSTPTHNVTELDTQIILGESMDLASGDRTTQDQVHRIKNLFKSTETMLKQ